MVTLQTSSEQNQCGTDKLGLKIKNTELTRVPYPHYGKKKPNQNNTPSNNFVVALLAQLSPVPVDGPSAALSLGVNSDLA